MTRACRTSARAKWQRRRQRVTFGAVAEDFIKDKLPGERGAYEVARAIRRELLPGFGKRPITEITPLDMRTAIKAIKDRGAPAMAYSVLKIARRLFVWAIDQHVYGIEASPCAALKPKALAGALTPRNRILDDDELRAFWRAAGELHISLRAILSAVGVKRITPQRSRGRAVAGI